MKDVVEQSAMKEGLDTLWSSTLGDAWNIFRKRWLLFLLIVVVGVCAFLVGGLFTRTTYRTTATLAITEPDSSGGVLDLSGSLSGLASLAGVSIGGANDRAAIIAVLGSRALASTVIAAENLLPVLFPNDWDEEDQRWRPGKEAPAAEAAFRRWNSDMFQLAEDNLTGLVTVSIRAPTPELAQKWADSYLMHADNELRTRAIEEAEQNVDFLSSRLIETQQVEIRASIGRLLERELYQLMLAQGKALYAFQIVDKPFKPDRPYKPNYPLLAALGFVFGILVCIAVGTWLIASSHANGTNRRS